MRVNPVTSSRCIAVRRAAVSLFMWLLIALGYGAATVSQAAGIAITKTVDDPTLMTGAAVEFAVTVQNHPQADPAEKVVVSDQLPEGLEIPDGTTPFASQGVYDTETGVWSVGDLSPSAEATLQIPASVNADPLPPCIVNRAVVEGEDYAGVPLSAAAALYRPDTERCVDLALIIEPPTPNPFGCGVPYVEVILRVRNDGPDDARNVVVDIEDSPNQPPGFVFENPNCEPDKQCTLESLDAGQLALLVLRSDSGITDSVEREFDVSFAVSIAEPDFNAGQTSAFASFTKQPYEECEAPASYSIPGIGGGSGGCFIATAAFGSAMHPHVEALRSWRDRVLLTNLAGRAFVDFYYRYSPPLADYIAERPTLRSVVRVLLWPIVIAVLHPLLVTTIVCFVMIGLIFGGRRRTRGA